MSTFKFLLLLVGGQYVIDVLFTNVEHDVLVRKKKRIEKNIHRIHRKSERSLRRFEKWEREYTKQTEMFIKSGYAGYNPDLDFIKIDP